MQQLVRRKADLKNRVWVIVAFSLHGVLETLYWKSYLASTEAATHLQTVKYIFKDFTKQNFFVARWYRGMRKIATCFLPRIRGRPFKWCPLQWRRLSLQGMAGEMLQTAIRVRKIEYFCSVFCANDKEAFQAFGSSSIVHQGNTGVSEHPNSLQISDSGFVMKF
jgi:hypothetical protein